MREVFRISLSLFLVGIRNVVSLGLIFSKRDNERIVVDRGNNQIQKWQSHKLVAHALGSINNTVYSNCYEALESSYELGFKVFEVDLLLTSDDYLVCNHSWLNENYVQYSRTSSFAQFFSGARKQIQNFFGNLRLYLDENYLDAKARSLQEFNDYVYKKGYTPLTMINILEFMKTHEDMYLITDTKNDDERNYSKQFSILMNLIGESGIPVGRIIPQVYNIEMYNYLENFKFFNEYIFTLYKSTDSNSAILSQVENTKISTIAMSSLRRDNRFIKQLKAKGLHSFVFTVNNKREAQEYFKNGVSGIYTDFITPTDLK